MRNPRRMVKRRWPAHRRSRPPNRVLELGCGYRLQAALRLAPLCGRLHRRVTDAAEMVALTAEAGHGHPTSSPSGRPGDGSPGRLGAFRTRSSPSTSLHLLAQTLPNSPRRGAHAPSARRASAARKPLSSAARYLVLWPVVRALAPMGSRPRRLPLPRAAQPSNARSRHVRASRSSRATTCPAKPPSRSSSPAETEPPSPGRCNSGGGPERSPMVAPVGPSAIGRLHTTGQSPAPEFRYENSAPAAQRQRDAPTPAHFAPPPKRPTLPPMVLEFRVRRHLLPRGGCTVYRPPGAPSTGAL